MVKTRFLGLVFLLLLSSRVQADDVRLPAVTGTEIMFELVHINREQPSILPREKCMRYIDFLEEALKKEPDNARYVLYLADWYRLCGEKIKALIQYEKRLSMGGSEEELFWAMVQRACLQKQLHFSEDTVLDSFSEAHRLCPYRAEPVYYLAEMYNQLGQLSLALETLKGREFVSQETKPVLFRMSWITDYGLLFQQAITSLYMGRYEESLAACTTLLANKNLPERWRGFIEQNRLCAQNKGLLTVKKE